MMLQIHHQFEKVQNEAINMTDVLNIIMSCFVLKAMDNFSHEQILIFFLCCSSTYNCKDFDFKQHILSISLMPKHQ